MRKYNFLTWLLLGQGKKFNKIIEEFIKYNKKDDIELIRKRIQDRIKSEDTLFNSRTNIFLVLNGLAAIAIGDKYKINESQIIVPTIAILINFIWFYCSRQSIKVLAGLYASLIRLEKSEAVETLVQNLLGSSRWFRPATMLAVYLPIIVIICWFIVIFLIIL